jgi:hypothetical protein
LLGERARDAEAGLHVLEARLRLLDGHLVDDGRRVGEEQRSGALVGDAVPQGRVDERQPIDGEDAQLAALGEAGRLEERHHTRS